MHATRALVWLLALALAACATERRYLASSNPELPFSNAVLSGDTLYLAGHLGLDPATGAPPEDAMMEASRMLDAFEATLDRAGMSMDDLVQVQVFCSDVLLYEGFNRLYHGRFTQAFPARAFIGSGPLLRGCRFEIQGIAQRR